MSASVDYWLKRAEANMDLVQAQADQRLQVIAKAMQRAQQTLTEDAQRIFRTFAGKFNLTDAEAQAALAEPLGRAEYDRLIAKIATLPAGAERTALEIRANSGAYAYRITRAEALRENIAVETTRFSQVVEDELTGQLRFTAVEGYNRSMFDLQRQTGSAFAVPDIHSAKIAINAPWAGGNYSSRIWGNGDKLAEALREQITSGYLSGTAHAKVARSIGEQFGVSFRNAERLVRTETSYIANQAHLQTYLDAGIEQYRYKTALDSRTCERCAPLDGQVFNVSDAVVGKNYPPLHPNCRCTTGAAIELTENSQRRGRDANGNSVLLPADMTYSEWQEWQLAGAPSDIAAWRNSILDSAMKTGYTVTVDGISTSTTKHMLMRLQERGVSLDSVTDALQNPLHITAIKIGPDGRPSKRYIGKSATVNVNPDTGAVATVWKTGKTALKKFGKGAKK